MKKDLKTSLAKHVFTRSIIVLMMLLGIFNTAAQSVISPQKTTTENDRTVSGIVIGDDGQSIPGVDVILQGSKIGTITNAEGEFTFPKLLKKGDVLLFHYLGFKSTKHVIDEDELNVINLEVNIVETNEVVLCGDIAISGNFKSKRSHWKKKKTKE